MAFNWFKKSDPLAGVEGSKGKRTTDGKSSARGWTDRRDRDSAAPLKTPPPNSDSGWSATGRKPKGKGK